MYNDLFFCKKSIDPAFTKINKVCLTYNMRTKFELSGMHRLDAVTFTHIHADQAVQWLGQPAAVPKVLSLNPG